MENVAKLQGDSPVLRGRACSRWAKEGTTPFGTTSKALQSQGIPALDNGAPCTAGRSWGRRQRLGCRWELPHHLLGDITPLRLCLLLHWDHAQQGCSSLLHVRAVDTKQWCWGE